MTLSPLTPKISSVHVTVCHTVLVMLGEFGVRSTYNPFTDIFLNSHRLCA